MIYIYIYIYSFGKLNSGIWHCPDVLKFEAITVLGCYMVWVGSLLLIL